RYTKLVLGEKGELKDLREARSDDGNARGQRYGVRDEVSVMRKSGPYRGPGDSAPASAANQAVAVGGALEMDRAKKEAGAAGEPDAPVQVRTDFRETALWKPDLVTDAKGEATIRVTYPESLTRWKATARASTGDARFGIGSAATRTQKPLIARLEVPRFF